MVAIVKAHIKNEKNANIKVVVFDSVNGAILRQKVIEHAPNSKGVDVAKDWLTKEYRDFEFTTEGISGTDERPPPPPTNEEPPPSLEDGKTLDEILQQRGDLTKPTPVTKKDGTIVLEGHTVVDRDINPDKIGTPPTSTEGEMEITLAEMDLALADAESLAKAKASKEVEVESLPQVRLELPEFRISPDATTEQKASQLRLYGDRLARDFLVVGSDFSAPPAGQANVPNAQEEAKRAKCKEDKEKALKENIEERMVNVRGNTYHLGDKPLPADGDKCDPVQAKVDANEPVRADKGTDVSETVAEETPHDEGIELKPVVPKVKRAIQRSGLTKKEKENYDKLPKSLKASNQGAYGDHLLDPVPTYRKAPVDVVLKNRYNSWIVLGRDRTDSLKSGFGGKGNTQCAAIDIVAGRMSPTPKTVDKKGNLVYVDPIFNVAYNPHDESGNRIPSMDAARIYLSQKTLVDQNFKLNRGSIGNNEEKPNRKDTNPRSAIALKADGIRVIAREGIKLVTGVDGYNSQGGQMTIRRGVDIIAGNGKWPGSGLQPMVLGDNMADCLFDLGVIVSETVGAVQSIIENLAITNVLLSSHVHLSPFFGLPTTPAPGPAFFIPPQITKLASVDTFSNGAGKWDITRWRQNYLRPNGAKRIKSKWNNVN